MSNCIEYFTTIGRPDGPFECKLWESEVGSGKYNVHPRDLWGEAITDIAFVMAKESIPEDKGWEIIYQSADHREMNPPHLAVRRRKHSQRLDHITQIILVPSADKAPRGFEVIKHSITGVFSAYLNPIGFIAILRAEKSAAAYLEGEPLIDDFCLVLLYHKEEIPERYTRAAKITPPRTDGTIGSTLAAAGMGNLSLSLGGAFGSSDKQAQDKSDVVAIAYHSRPPMGLCDLSYTSAALDRYPFDDLKGLELPVNELPMFAFPGDLRIVFSQAQHRPKETFFTFVFTDIKGNNMHAACLKFYECVPHSDVEVLFEKVYGEDKVIKVLPGTEIFCPRVIVVLSSKPYYTQMRRYLKQLYSMSISSLPCPLEYYIASVIRQVPLPLPGGRPFSIMMDAALIAPTSRPMAPLIFSLPPREFFPLLDLDFSAPFRCLSPENVLAVLTLLLEEAKVLFVCSSNTLLSETMECIRALLFPLSWPSTFVSSLPAHMSTYLEAPGGFMIGIYAPKTPPTHFHPILSKPEVDYSKSRVSNWAHSILPGTYIVDLSTNQIAQWSDSHIETELSPAHIANIVKSLPHNPRRRLLRKLELICDEFSLGPQRQSMEGVDLVFSAGTDISIGGVGGMGKEGMGSSIDDDGYQQRPRVGSGVSPNKARARRWSAFPTLEVRDGFMVLMADILGSYQLSIIPPSVDMTADSYRTFQESFACDDYLMSAGRELRPLLEKFLETQIFASFLQQREEGSSLLSLVFFENVAELLREIGFSYSGQGGRGKGDTDLPAPAYILYAAYSRWNQSNPSHQDQVLSQYLKIIQAETRKTIFLPSLSSPLTSLGQGRDRTQSGTATPTGQGMGTQPGGLITLEHCLCMLKYCEDQGLALYGHGDFDVSVNGSETRDMAALSLKADRHELDSGYQLHLDDLCYGPLVIPGPYDIRHVVEHSSNNFPTHKSDPDSSVPPPPSSWMLDSPPHSAPSSPRLSTISVVSATSTTSAATDTYNDKNLQDSVKFSYPSGWPRMNKDYFTSAIDSVHPQVKLIFESQTYTLSKVDAKIHRLFIRPAADRFAFTHNARLHSTLSHSTIYGKALAPAGASGSLPSESLSVVSSLRDVICSTLLMLSFRAQLGVSPDGDMLQILGVLSQCESLGVLSHIDQTTFKGMMYTCASMGGDMMRRVACVLYETVLTHEIGVDVDLAGQHASALAKKSSKENAGVNNKAGVSVDQFLYLEEMGLWWVAQKLSLKDDDVRVRAATLSTDSTGKDKQAKNNRDRVLSASSSFLESVGLGSGASTPIVRDTSPRPRPAANTVLTALSVAKELGLIKESGLLSFAGPAALRWASVPREPESFMVSSAACNPITATPTTGTDAATDPVNQIRDNLTTRMKVIQSDIAAINLSGGGVSSGDDNGSRSGSRRGQGESSIDSGAGQADFSISEPHASSHNASAVPDGAVHSKRNDFVNMLIGTYGSPAAMNLPLPPVSSTPVTSDALANSVAVPPTPLSSTSTTVSVPESACSSDSGMGSPVTAGVIAALAAGHAEGAGRASLDNLGFSDDEDDDEDISYYAENGDVPGAMDASTRKAERAKRRSTVREGAPQISSHAKHTDTPDTPLQSNLASDMAAEAINPAESQAAELCSSKLQEEAPCSVQPLQPPESVISPLPARSGSVQFTSSPIPTQDESISGAAPFSPASSSATSTPATTSNPTTAITIQALQSQILTLFEKETQMRGRAIGIWSRSPCTCGHAMLDEEVIAYWLGFGHMNVATHLASKDIVGGHCVYCPDCRMEVGIKLQVRCYETTSASGAGTGSGTAAKAPSLPSINGLSIATVWESEVLLLSPFGLRFGIEDVIALVGKQVVDGRWLYHYRPDLFWGLYWYTTRLKLPCGLLGNDDNVDIRSSVSGSSDASSGAAFLPQSWCGPVVIGWRQSVVQAHVLRLLASKSPSTEALTLRDVFPKCTKGDIEIAKSVVGAIDGSTVGMRLAMMQLVTIPAILKDAGEGEGGGNARNARSIYVALLTLCYLFHSHLFATKANDPVTVLLGLGKVVSYDRLFIDTIKCVLTPSDLLTLGTTERHLLDAVATRAEQAVRVGFGFMY